MLRIIIVDFSFKVVNVTVKLANYLELNFFPFKTWFSDQKNNSGDMPYYFPDSCNGSPKFSFSLVSIWIGKVSWESLLNGFPLFFAQFWVQSWNFTFACQFHFLHRYSWCHLYFVIYKKKQKTNFYNIDTGLCACKGANVLSIKVDEYNMTFFQYIFCHITKVNLY